jgi:hypothetical protein
MMVDMRNVERDPYDEVMLCPLDTHHELEVVLMGNQLSGGLVRLLPTRRHHAMCENVQW